MQIRHLLLILPVIIISTTMISCEDKREGQHWVITLNNESDYNLLVKLKNGAYGTLPSELDTVNTNYPRDMLHCYVESHSTNTRVLKLDEWGTYEEFFNYVSHIHVFIYRECDLLDYESFSKLSSRKQDEYLTKQCVRYDLSLEDLNQLNWSISFPPDDRMKGINVYYSKDIYNELYPY